MKLTRVFALFFLVFTPPCLWGWTAEAQAQRSGAEKERLRERESVPPLMKYAGTLRDTQGAPRSGAVSVTVAIYAEQEGGAALWQETQNVALDADGRYSVLLGAASRDGMPAELFATGEPRWLGVRVNVAGDVEASQEQARVLLVSVPYALRAADADTLGGRAATDFVLREELIGWSGVASGLLPGAADAPRAVGGTQGAVFATGAVNFMPRVTAINTPAAGDVTYANSQIFDDGTNIRIGNAAVGTGLVNIELTTPLARNAFNSTLRLENTAPITGTIISAMNLTGADRAASDHESFQVARFTLLKNVISTGVSTNFDAVFATTAFINANAPYTIVGWRAEFPRVAAGMTLNTFYGLFLEAPLGGGGAVTNAFALVTAPGSGNVGIGTVTPAYLFDVAGNARVSGALRAGQYLDLAGNPVAGTGTVTQVNSGAGITGGPITGTGTLALDTTFTDARYLQLTGGTLTGLLSGTTAAFTGGVTVATANIGGSLTLGGTINGGLRVLATAGAPNIIGGSSDNFVIPGTQGATIAGGGTLGLPNRVTDNFGTVGGGHGNRAGDNDSVPTSLPWATVGGGIANVASGIASTVGGGDGNTASQQHATVGGGSANVASALRATVGGGRANLASGDFATVAGGLTNTAGGLQATVGGGDLNTANGSSSTVPGGSSNAAAGQFSFAAGRRAIAIHNGSFVWGDSTDADVFSSVDNEFVVRAAGGVRFRNAVNSIVTISPAGTVTAAAFVGDGSGLTNLPGGGGTVTNLATGTGLTGGPITGSGTIAFDTAFGDARYLTVTGGTLTGGLLGATASFSGDVAANNLMMAGALNNGFRVVPTLGTPSVVGGFTGNTNSGQGNTIGGGGEAGTANSATGNFGTVAGGQGNTVGTLGAVGGGATNAASGAVATIPGGQANSASANFSTVGGGSSNLASGNHSTVAGGVANTASGLRASSGGGEANSATGNNSTVAGGAFNTAGGNFSMVPGGDNNTASMDYAFAAGRRAQAIHAGAFVWADSTDLQVFSAAANEFVVRASGGVRFRNVLSDIVTISPTGTVTAAAFVGDGSGLTNLPSAITSVDGLAGGTLTSALTVAGDMTAAKFIGDGSMLTNLPGGGGGDITDVIAGTGLTGGAATGAATLNFDTAFGDARYLTLTGGALTGILNGTGAAFTGGVSVATANVGGDLTVGGSINNGLRIAIVSDTANVTGGHLANAVSLGAIGAFIGGGGTAFSLASCGLLFPPTAENRVTDNFGTVAGGCANQAGDGMGGFDVAAFATVGGGRRNSASAFSATVAGGESNTASGAQSVVGGGSSNTASGGAATVAGGGGNQSTNSSATVGGGSFNTAGGDASTIAGGESHQATGLRSTIGGGANNLASGESSVIAGGQGNDASGLRSMILGGLLNTAAGELSLAAGNRAKANHDGAFVWADASTAVDFASTGNNQFLIRAAGGVGIGTDSPTEALHVNGNILASGTITPSSRRFKMNILPLTGALGLVERLQGVSYTRKDDGKADIGFIAEDLGAVLPQVVLWEANGTDAKGLDYARLTAVLVEAVKEQQAQLHAQQAQIEKLARQLEQLRAAQQPK